jgi:glycosyltransferase involved in cell wall biosynthesis
MNLKSNKKISVIIPTKNGCKYVWAAIDSVLSQDYRDMELIVSVNYSNDQTLAMLKKLKDSRLRILIPPKPLPMAEHFEWCINHSRGEWITVIGDDDGLMPFFFKEFENLIKSWKKNVDVFTFRRAYYFWPGCEKLYDKFEVYVKSQKKQNQISGKVLLTRASFLDLEHYDLPQIYTNNIIKKKLIENIKKKSNGKLFHEPCPDIYSGVVISLLAKKIIRSENSIFWTGTSPKSTGFKTYISNSTKIMLDFKKRNKTSGIKISEEIGLEAWTFLRSASLFMLSSIYNAPFITNKILKHKRLLMFLFAPRIYNEIDPLVKRFNINNKFYKKKMLIFKDMLTRNNLINFFLFIKLIAKILKIIKALSKIIFYLNDFFYKSEFKIILRKEKKIKIRDLSIANKILLSS